MRSGNPSSKPRFTLERVVYALAILFFIALALLAGKPSFTNASKPQHGIKDPEIALQTAATLYDVDAVLADVPSPDREVMRIKQYVGFGLIATYTALSAVMLLYVRRLLRAAHVANRTAAGLLLAISAGVALTALWDFLENANTLTVVHVSLAQLTPVDLYRLRSMSLRKWTSASVSMLMLASLWLAGSRTRSGKKAWQIWAARTAGLIEFVAGAIGLTGAFAQDQANLLSWAGRLMAAGLLLNAVTLKFLMYESPSQD